MWAKVVHSKQAESICIAYQLQWTSYNETSSFTYSMQLHYSGTAAFRGGQTCTYFNIYLFVLIVSRHWKWMK